MAPMAAVVEQNTDDMPSGGMQQAGAMRLEELPCHIARRYWLRSRAERRAESEQDLPELAAAVPAASRALRRSLQCTGSWLVQLRLNSDGQ